MFLDQYLKEDSADGTTMDDVDMLAAATVNPDSPEAIEAMAHEVEQHMTAAALENMTYFDGGNEFVHSFTESAEVQAMVEARKLGKRTFVRLGKVDDLQRRKNLACLVLAKAHNDPLWTKLAKNRVMERKLRNAIYAKYGTKGDKVAKKSQLVHIKNARKLPALQNISFLNTNKQ